MVYVQHLNKFYVYSYLSKVRGKGKVTQVLYKSYNDWCFRKEKWNKLKSMKLREKKNQTITE